TVVITAWERGVDPDNVAGPLVAGAGDVVCVLLLGVIATMCLHWPELATGCIVMIIAVLQLCWRAAREWPSTMEVLRDGWAPLLANLLLSCLAGSALEAAADVDI